MCIVYSIGSTGQVFFAGGPVWAMDWLPNQLEQEPGSAATQYLALSAYKKLLEVLYLSPALLQLVIVLCVSGVPYRAADYMQRIDTDLAY